MIFFNINRILAIKGITKPYTYFMSIGYSRGSASQLAGNKMRSFTLTSIEKLCTQLNCTPNDLFEFIPNATQKLPDDHALNQLKREQKVEEINKLLNNLPMDKIRELAELVSKENPANS
jgi:DNA-binding Xre family transcriptional regulator